MAEFEDRVRALRSRVGSGPELVSRTTGVTIPYLGTEVIERRRMNDGSIQDFHLLQRSGLGIWVVTAAFDKEGNLIIVPQHKYGVDEVTIELAPGGVGKCDNPDPSADEIIALAQPVFTRETGYAGGAWEYLGFVNVDDNKYRDAHGRALRAHLLIAEGVARVAEPQPQATETYEVITVPPSDFPALLASPYLQETSAVACLYRAFMARGTLDWTTV